MEPPDLEEETPSIGAVFAIFNDASSVSEDYPDDPAAFIATCSVFANWQLADIYAEQPLDAFVHSSSIDATYNTLSGIDHEEDLLRSAGYLNKHFVRPIKFDINWANTALPPNSTIGNLARRAGSENISLNNGFGASTSVFVADVISRFGMEALQSIALDPNNLLQITSKNRFEKIITNVTANNMTEFKVLFHCYGYAYSMEGLTRRLAAGVLLAHALIATIYTALIIRFGWSCHGLGSVMRWLSLL